MLLLGGSMGTPGEPIDQIWCVAVTVRLRSDGSRSPGKAILVQHTGNIKIEATLKPATLPDGWRIINNRGAAQRLKAAEAGDDG